jgi:hypothetical protein
MPVILAIRRLRQEDEFKFSLGYTERPCVKKQIQVQWLTFVISASGGAEIRRNTVRG